MSTCEARIRILVRARTPTPPPVAVPWAVPWAVPPWGVVPWAVVPWALAVPLPAVPWALAVPRNDDANDTNDTVDDIPVRHCRPDELARHSCCPRMPRACGPSPEQHARLLCAAHRPSCRRSGTTLGSSIGEPELKGATRRRTTDRDRINRAEWRRSGQLSPSFRGDACHLVTIPRSKGRAHAIDPSKLRVFDRQRDA